MRDLRDPQKLGERVEGLRRHIEHTEGMSCTFKEAYDTGILNGWLAIPDYPQDESMATVTAREYREELAAAAAAGDIYAASMLKGIPYDEPGDHT